MCHFTSSQVIPAGSVPNDALFHAQNTLQRLSHTKDATACIQINPMTVYGMLREQNIPKGEFLLQTAATSVLGRQMISLAKHYGVQTINVVRRKEAVDELKSIG